MIGTVKKVLRVEGFGFIEVADGVDRFFHRTAVLDGRFNQLRVGQIVEFEHEDGVNGKGPRAVEIRVKDEDA